MASSSTSSPYPKRKRAQVSYAEINSDVVDLDNSQSDADAVAPPAKVFKLGNASSTVDQSVNDFAIEVEEAGLVEEAG